DPGAAGRHRPRDPQPGQSVARLRHRPGAASGEGQEGRLRALELVRIRRHQRLPHLLAPGLTPIWRRDARPDRSRTAGLDRGDRGLRLLGLAGLEHPGAARREQDDRAAARRRHHRDRPPARRGRRAGASLALRRRRRRDRRFLEPSRRRVRGAGAEHASRGRAPAPERLTTAEIVAILNGTPGLEGSITRRPAEGRLLPETYFYALGDPRQGVLERMRNAQAKAVDELWAARAKDLPFEDPDEALVLASIVEKETGRDDERAHVAGVFLNRLRLGMRLQADPTVIYAITKGERTLDRPLGHDDLGIESPYNTYLVQGLPPTPIANPGLASIRAALRPLKTDDLYFV